MSRRPDSHKAGPCFRQCVSTRSFWANHPVGNTASLKTCPLCTGRFEEVKQTAEVAVEAALPSNGVAEGAKETLRQVSTHKMFFWVVAGL